MIDVFNIYGATQQILTSFVCKGQKRVWQFTITRKSFPNKKCVLLQFALKIATFQRDTSTFELKVPISPDSVSLDRRIFIGMQTQVHHIEYTEINTYLSIHMSDIYTGWWFIRSLFKWTNGDNFHLGTFVHLFFFPFSLLFSPF